LIVVTSLLLFEINSIDISYKESDIFFEQTGILNLLTNLSANIFGLNNFAIRLPTVIIYFISNILFFKLTRYYLNKYEDRVTASLIFLLLPGVIAGAIVVHISIVLIMFVLLYLYIYEKTKHHCIVVLVVIAFLDNSSMILFLSLIFYSIKRNNKNLKIVSGILFVATVWWYGFETSGKPQSYFEDTIGVYLSIFSPLLFLYLLYSLYRYAIKNQTSLLWFISTTAITSSILLSFRQKIILEDFAPYVVMAVIIVVGNFLRSYRVRVPKFRKPYKYLANVVLFVLVSNSVLLVYNKPLYMFIDKPKDHFAFAFHFKKELALKLHQEGISCVDANDRRLQKSLKFYGIRYCDKTQIYTKKPQKYSFEVKNLWKNRYICSYFVVY